MNHLLIGLKVKIDRLKTSIRAKKAIDNLDVGIVELEKLLEQVESHDADFEELIRLNIYCYLFHRDLCIAMKSTVSASKNEQHFHLRTLVLLIFEYIERIHKVLGSGFYQSLMKYTSDTNLPSKYKLAGKKLNIIRKEHSAFLKEIRDNSVAHRTYDYALQINVINNLDIIKIMSLWTEVSDFQSVLFDIWSYVFVQKMPNKKMKWD